MNTIVLKYTHNKEDFLRFALLEWKCGQLKTIKQAKVSLIVSLLFLLLHFVTYKVPSAILFFLSFAIFLFFLGVLVYFKKHYNHRIEKMLYGHDGFFINYRFELSDEYIKYSEDSIETKMSWQTANYYSIYKDVLLIWDKNDVILIELKDKTLSEEITNLVRSKLPYKKVAYLLSLIE